MSITDICLQELTTARVTKVTKVMVSIVPILMSALKASITVTPMLIAQILTAPLNASVCSAGLVTEFLVSTQMSVQFSINRRCI